MEKVWDPLRKKEVALTPEEKVRQWFIGVLREDALEIALGETVHVAFKGKTLVMCWQTTPDGTVYTQLDSEARHRLINGNPHGTQRILFEGLSSGSHNLAIQAKGTVPMFIQRVYAFQ